MTATRSSQGRAAKAGSKGPSTSAYQKLMRVVLAMLGCDGILVFSLEMEHATFTAAT